MPSRCIAELERDARKNVLSDLPFLNRLTQKCLKQLERFDLALERSMDIAMGCSLHLLKRQINEKKLVFKCSPRSQRSVTSGCELWPKWIDNCFWASRDCSRHRASQSTSAKFGNTFLDCFNHNDGRGLASSRFNLKSKISAWLVMTVGLLVQHTSLNITWQDVLCVPTSERHQYACPLHTCPSKLCARVCTLRCLCVK